MQHGSISRTISAPTICTFISVALGTILRAGNGGTGLVAVALDPAHPMYASNAYIAVINGAGQPSFTKDSTATWTGYQSTTRTATDIPWLQNTNENFMSAYQITYDPAQSNILYFSEGIGVWTTTPTTGNTVAWMSKSTSIEQLVSQLGH